MVPDIPLKARALRCEREIEPLQLSREVSAQLENHFPQGSFIFTPLRIRFRPLAICKLNLMEPGIVGS